MLEVFPLHFISSEDVTLCVIQVTLNNLMLLFNLATVALKTPLMQEKGFEKVHSRHHTLTTLKKCTFSSGPME